MARAKCPWPLPLPHPQVQRNVKSYTQILLPTCSWSPTPLTCCCHRAPSHHDLSSGPLPQWSLQNRSLIMPFPYKIAFSDCPLVLRKRKQNNTHILPLPARARIISSSSPPLSSPQALGKISGKSTRLRLVHMLFPLPRTLSFHIKPDSSF